jgi:hypothetical protein
MLDFAQAGWWPLQLLGSSLHIHLQLGGPHANVASTVVFLIFESLLVDHANKSISPPLVMKHLLSTHLCEWLGRVSQCGVHVGVSVWCACGWLGRVSQCGVHVGGWAGCLSVVCM